MLGAVASKGKPIFLATGASDLSEVITAVDFLSSFEVPLALLQCTTNYTGSETNFDYVNLNVISTYKNLFPDVILGLSDHTPGAIAAIGAVALGARVIEKHFTDDRNRLGPDHGFSLEAREWKEMVQQVRILERALGDGLKQVEENERETVILQRRSWRVTKDLSKGHILSGQDLQALRPAPSDSIAPSQPAEVIGKRLKRSLVAGDYVRWSDLST
jgi:N-acetylneuraminate synthase